MRQSVNVEPDTKWSIPFGPGAASGALRRAFVVPNEAFPVELLELVGALDKRRYGRRISCHGN